MGENDRRPGETPHRGREHVDWIFTFTMAVYDLIRIRTLIRVGICPA